MKIIKHNVLFILFLGFTLSGYSSSDEPKPKTEGEKFLELCTSKNDEFKNCVNKIKNDINISFMKKIADVKTCEESVFTPHRKLVEKEFPTLNLRGFNWTGVGESILVCVEKLIQEQNNCIVDIFLTHINTECQRFKKLLEK